MTFKSIRASLESAEAKGQLLRFCPVFDPDESEKRELWVPPSIHRWLYENSGGASRNYKANVRGFLKRFVIGEYVDNFDFMKSWKANVFSLRVQLMPRDDNTRMFGGFAEEDCLVLFKKKPRAWFDHEGRWDQMIADTETEWAKQFGSFKRLNAAPFRNCVSRNAHDTKTGETW